jgi:hypothetical protein
MRRRILKASRTGTENVEGCGVRKSAGRNRLTVRFPKGNRRNDVGPACIGLDSTRHDTGKLHTIRDCRMEAADVRAGLAMLCAGRIRCPTSGIVWVRVTCDEACPPVARSRQTMGAMRTMRSSRGGAE